jgi:hypothetical protein
MQNCQKMEAIGGCCDNRRPAVETISATGSMQLDSALKQPTNDMPPENAEAGWCASHDTGSLDMVPKDLEMDLDDTKKPEASQEDEQFQCCPTLPSGEVKALILHSVRHVTPRHVVCSRQTTF